MATSLVSAGVSVQIIDQSFYVSGQAATTPLIFVATADEKFQADGITPALGTFEHGIIREVTSIQQSLQLYGVPTYLTDAAGNPFHGDARNEYGLDALNKVLSVGNTAYVVRANVNLNDDVASIKSLWDRKTKDAADYLSTLVQDYIQQYNLENNFVPADTGYISTVNGTTLKTLVNEAVSDTFASYSFSSQPFQNAFIQDHSVVHPGYQDVLFDTNNGYIQLSDITGLVSANQYGADIEIVTTTGTQTFNVTILGNQATTFGDLVATLNTAIGAAGTVSLLNGRIRITSALSGVTSGVDILSDGPSGLLPLFGSLNLFMNFDTPISGTGATALNVYDSTYTTIIGTYEGLDSLISTWVSGNTVPDEFTPAEAEGLFVTAEADFEGTKEFRTYTLLGTNDAARRAAIVKALNAIIADPTTGVTAENIQYDIVGCPGYWECTNALVVLSQAVRSEVFVVGDVPFDKPALGPNGMTVWAASPARVNNYVDGYWYGHGISTNVDGAVIMSTAACTALRTIVYSDSVGEKWFAPAGTTRGTCPQLSNIGYVSGTLGTATTFVTDYLDQGTRDALYQFPININPITYIPGRGIVVLGQKTSSPVTSSLDRVNVVRLTMYIARQLRQTLFNYLFEPNDKKTWDNVKYNVDTFMNNLVQRRGLYDFLSVVDASNNTGATIDNNELHIDLYIAPEKDIEFIYLDITLVNTGTDLSGLQQVTT
jgi:hypothetical protein